MISLWRAFLQEAKSWPASGRFWWLMLLAPVIAVTVVCLLLGSGILRELPVALCDLDQTRLSRQVAGWVDSTPSMRIAKLALDPADGNAMLKRGDVFAVIIIPRGFEQDMLRNRPTRAIAYVEGQHMASAGILSSDLSNLGIALWREQDIHNRRQSGVPGTSALSQSSTVGLDIRPIANPGINYRIFLLPGILPALLQLAATLAAVYSLHALNIRRRNGHRKGHMQLPLGPHICGTLLAVTAWFWLLGLGMAGALMLHGDLTIAGSRLVMSMAYLLFTLASVALGTLLFGIGDTLIQKLSIVSAFSSPAFAFAGLTFPVESMPLIGRMWSSLLPVTHLLKIQVTCGQLGASALSQQPSFIALALITICMGTAGIALANQRLAQKNMPATDAEGHIIEEIPPATEDAGNIGDAEKKKEQSLTPHGKEVTGGTA